MKRPKSGERPARGKATRSNNPERTRRDIIEVATKEFATKGLSGARIDEIAARTRTSKRMIYYYFGSKEKLYLAVLESAYAAIRATEETLDLDHLPPEDALRTLVAFTFDYENSHPDFIHLVMNENMHKGRYLARSRTIQKVNLSVIDAIRRIYRRGCDEGVFRAGLDAVDLHMSISALCFFNVANRYTFSLIFGRDMDAPKALARRRSEIAELILSYVRR